MRNAMFATMKKLGITFSPLHPVLAAECKGVDISEPISPEVADAIHDGMDQYGVLVFRDQKFTDQVALQSRLRCPHDHWYWYSRSPH